MEDINERLRAATRAGFDAKLKALLGDPGCDALAKDANGVNALMYAALSGVEVCVRILLPVSDVLATSRAGQTALMWAAYAGREACVRLLLPLSNALAEDEDGRTASCLAREEVRESLAQFIDAYALSQAEQAAIGDAVSTSSPRKRAAPRV